jgi:hypothetical protein
MNFPKLSWLVIGVMSLGLAVVSDGVRAADKKEDKKEEKKENKQKRDRFDDDGDALTYNELPGPAKQAVGKTLGQGSEVVDVRRIYPKGEKKATYRAEIEENKRSRVMWVTEGGEVLRKTDITDEGRTRVSLNEVPGEVKGTLQKEAGGKQYKRIVQATEDKDTWYIGYLDDGRIVRVDSKGKLMKKG